MGIQGAVEATITWKEEGAVLGVLPSATGAKRLRRVSSSLNGKKASFASNEVRSDQQVSDMRHGMRSVAGGIETELAIVPGGDTLDTLIAMAMRASGWVNGVSAAPAQFATGITIANSGQGSTITFAGSGNLLTLGFRLGDIVRLTGTTNPANSGVNVRITALTGTVMTVFPQLAASGQQASGWTAAVQGSKVLLGTAKRSLMIEQSYGDAGVHERFMGCRIGGMGLNMGPTGMATASFDFLGQDFSENAAAYYTSPTGETSGGNLTSVDGTIRVFGQEMGVVTGLQLNVNHNLSNPNVAFSQKTPEIFHGRITVTGSVSVLLDGLGMLQAFDQEQEGDIVAMMETAANPAEFLAFNLQRVKFTDAQKTLGADGAVVLQMPFQGLLQGGVSSTTGKDLSSLVIQRSTTG